MHEGSWLSGSSLNIVLSDVIAESLYQKHTARPVAAQVSCILYGHCLSLLTVAMHNRSLGGASWIQYWVYISCFWGCGVFAGQGLFSLEVRLCQ